MSILLKKTTTQNKNDYTNKDMIDSYSKLKSGADDSKVVNSNCELLQDKSKNTLLPDKKYSRLGSQSLSMKDSDEDSVNDISSKIGKRGLQQVNNVMVYPMASSKVNSKNMLPPINHDNSNELLNVIKKADTKIASFIDENNPSARKLSKRDKICDSDTEEENSGDEKDNKFVIMPDNEHKKKWDMLIAGILIYSAITLPFRVSFIDNEDGTFNSYLDNVFDSLFGIDLLLNFFSAYIDSEENIVKSRTKIIVNYLKSWFIIDVLSILPISTIMQPNSKKSANYSSLLRIARLPKLYRMIKMVKKGNMNKFTKFIMDKIKLTPNMEKLLYFICGFLILNHCSACIWYLMAKLQNFSPDCWVTRMGYIDSDITEIYIISFYWTLTTITTVGYGDISSGTSIERIYNMFIMASGVIMYSFAIGSLSTIVSTIDAKTAEINQKLQILNSIKVEFKIGEEIYDKVRKVIKYDQSNNQKDIMTFLDELPNKLRIELSKIIHDKLIEKLYFFKDQPPDFIAYVAPLLKPVKFSQNDTLYKISDSIEEMYFVAKGTVSFYLSKEYLEKEVKEVKKNNNFGEIEMCLNDKLTYNIKIKSRQCELFVLKKNEFLRLSVNFKEFFEKFLQKSLMMYLRFNDERKRLMKELEDAGLVVGLEVDRKTTSDLSKAQQLVEGVDSGEEDQKTPKVESQTKIKENVSDNSNDDNNQLNKFALNESSPPFKNSKSKASHISANVKNTRTSKVYEPNEANKFKEEAENSYLQKKSSMNSLTSQIEEGRGMETDIKKNIANPVSCEPANKANKRKKKKESYEKKRDGLINSFIEKVDTIVSYLEEKSYDFAGLTPNPMDLLKQLKSCQDNQERSSLVVTLQGILSTFFESNRK